MCVCLGLRLVVALQSGLSSVTSICSETWCQELRVRSAMQARSSAALLLVEPVCGQPHQEVGVCGAGAGSHEAAEERDPG